jgi:hypothetical protein
MMAIFIGYEDPSLQGGTGWVSYLFILFSLYSLNLFL